MKLLLMTARQEILDLRRRNEVLQAKVDTMEVFDRALRSSLPGCTMGYGEDVAWKLALAITEAESKEADLARRTPSETQADPPQQSGSDQPGS